MNRTVILRRCDPHVPSQCRPVLNILQLSKEFHALDALTCKTTGRVTVGHLQLGSRSAAGAEDVADLSSGEPQLTTCTDK